MVMDGLDSMSKAELLILCEKHKIDGGKTVAQMRYALKKFFETTDEPDAKKIKLDPLSLKAAPAVLSTPSVASGGSPVPASSSLGAGSGGPLCPAGELCSSLHSMGHRTAFKHGGEFRDAPYLCREGMSCPTLHDREHLKKYAHDDANLCKLGAECPQLYVMAHRKNFEHLGFRRNPFPCRDGAACSLLKDKAHLFKYAHEVLAPDPLPPLAAAAPSTSSCSLVGCVSVAPVAVLPPLPSKSLSGSSSSSTANPAVADPPSAPTACVTADAYAGKTLEDFPIESAVDAELTPIVKDSELFWELEERFNAHLQGRNEDYVEKRIKEGKKPIRFVLIGAELVVNPVLTARFEIKRRMMIAERDPKDCRERVSFHGTHPKNVKSIVKTGLLRFKHPLNPCKTQVDDGYFGTNRKGIYVSRYADYTLKYSNRVTPVEPKDEVKTIMFRTLPGKSKHMEKLVGAVDPTVGYDSHSSPTFLEWYLFDEAQACPHYVLTVRAVEDTRTAADDE
jgi:hypothetical protein